MGLRVFVRESGWRAAVPGVGRGSAPSHPPLSHEKWATPRILPEGCTSETQTKIEKRIDYTYEILIPYSGPHTWNRRSELQATNLFDHLIENNAKIIHNEMMHVINIVGHQVQTESIAETLIRQKVLKDNKSKYSNKKCEGKAQTLE